MSLTGATEKVRLEGAGLRLSLVVYLWPLLAALLAGGGAWGALQWRVAELELRARAAETCLTEVRRGVDCLQVDVGWIRRTIELRGAGPAAP